MPFFDPVNRTATPPPFGLELDYLPAVRSVAFELAQGGVPWFVIMKCLDHPNLTSISIDEESTWRCTTPLSIPPDLSLHGFRLTEFTYTTSQWRETESRIRGTDLQPTYTQESIYLRALVLAMSDTAESLTLPVETAPLFEMAAIDWPRLRMLSLIGEYTHPDQCRAIPLLLPRMPYLRSLSVKVIQREGTRHPRLLQALPETSFRLRSLAVSYPDPADPIFLSIGDGLTSLSLCDSPRHYFQSRYSSESLLAIFPTLTSSECLTILKRISAPQLSILELVYEADAAEDELLQYLPRAFPLLQELELHRYPASSADAVPYLHITRMLTAIKYLRALYLNLDITEDVYKSWKAPRNRKLQDQLVRSRNQRGRELVRVLQSCEHFEYVALPIHALYAGVWVLYRPAWWSGFNVEHDSPYAV
ncbi:hypothetical protein TRAPUB_7422 [Trametes pubescens]|uniref:F-box domain-containing protein n=1 Tax=Trametes pubescens TaxID=154538 RepID=A0A1M2V3K1_TRAPU|nr:hypothetical protein TRAPUB_7422 [Trametes pubescens]